MSFNHPVNHLCKACWVLLAVLLLSGCGSSPEEDAESVRFTIAPVDNPEGYVEFVGHVSYVPFDGGFYGLVNGADKYDPLLLPKDYQQDGMKVKVRARLRDWVSGREWGRMVHVVSIEPCCPEPEDD